MQHQRFAFLWSALSTFILVASINCTTAFAQDTSETVWPTKEWQTSIREISTRRRYDDPVPQPQIVGHKQIRLVRGDAASSLRFELAILGCTDVAKYTLRMLHTRIMTSE